MLARRALHLFAPVFQRHAHRPANRGKFAGGDESIAAIIAGAAQHDHPALLEAPHDLARDRRTGILHQLRFCDAAGHRQAIRGTHPPYIEQGIFGKAGAGVHRGCFVILTAIKAS
jgi:hypothetical protein